MLEWTTYDAPNAARLAYRGKITGDDYQAVMPDLERFLDEHEDARLLIDLTDFEGIDARAVLDDLRLTTRHANDFARVAAVTDARWQDAMLALSEVFTAADVRTFDPAERRAAEDWLLN